MTQTHSYSFLHSSFRIDYVATLTNFSVNSLHSTFTMTNKPYSKNNLINFKHVYILYVPYNTMLYWIMYSPDSLKFPFLLFLQMRTNMKTAWYESCNLHECFVRVCCSDDAFVNPILTTSEDIDIHARHERDTWLSPAESKLGSRHTFRTSCSWANKTLYAYIQVSS